jgi:hypothetical protein
MRMRIADRHCGPAFKWERWQKPNENWDHDYCFFESAAAEILNEIGALPH